MTQRNQNAQDLQRLTTRRTLRVALLLVLAIVPTAVYAGQVTGLVSFVNGTIADANQVNGNFSTIAAEVNDNDGRVQSLEPLLNQ